MTMQSGPFLTIYQLVEVVQEHFLERAADELDSGQPELPDEEVVLRAIAQLVDFGVITPFLDINGRHLHVVERATGMTVNSKSDGSPLSINQHNFQVLMENGSLQLEALDSQRYPEGSIRFATEEDGTFEVEHLMFDISVLVDVLGVLGIEIERHNLDRTRRDPLTEKIYEFLDHAKREGTAPNIRNAWNYILEDNEFDEREGNLVCPRQDRAVYYEVNRNAFSARLNRAKQDRIH